MEPDCNIVCNIRIKFGCQVAFKNRMTHFSSSFTYSSKNFSVSPSRLVSLRINLQAFHYQKEKTKKEKNVRWNCELISSFFISLFILFVILTFIFCFRIFPVTLLYMDCCQFDLILFIFLLICFWFIELSEISYRICFFVF